MQLPDDFRQKYNALLGNEAAAFFASYDAPVTKAYRLNPLKAAVTQPTGHAGAIRLPYGQWGYYGHMGGHSVAHTTGLAYSQEPSAQFVGEVLAPQPGERVLDLSAAPGGKTTHLASFMQQQGLLVANEIFLNRAKILSENVERMGIRNALVTSESPERLAERLPGYFDRVLVDAPCSGEGMFHKDPAACDYWHADYPQECANRQQHIMASAVTLLAPGGTLVYSTCTFAPEENEQLIAWVLSHYPELALAPITKPAGISDGRPAWCHDSAVAADMTKTARLWPHIFRGEGHFVAKLVKKAAAVSSIAPPVVASTPLTSAAQQQLADFWQATFKTPLPTHLRVAKDRVSALPADCPDLAGLRVLRAGVVLGTLKKQRFEPDHALALASHPTDVQQTYALTDAEWRLYVHGDVIRPTEKLQKGWVLVTAAGNGVGWAKASDSQLKNFYPKGLRFLARKSEEQQ